MERLLFVTDLSHEDRDEDLYLAARLGETYRLTIADATQAAAIAALGEHDVAFLRNAWPSSASQAAFDALESMARDGRLRTYNPPSRSRGFREDKRYLVGLHALGFATIPTFPSIQAYRGDTDHAVFKPYDGCSGRGVAYGPLADLPTSGGVYQPAVDVDHEVSLFFLDGAFSHALRTSGAGDRWDLREFAATREDVAWAEAFVEWNDMPYGLQRVDGARLTDGRLLLMEVEDFMPYLSLDSLEDTTRDRFVDGLMASLRRVVEDVPDASRRP